MSWSRGTLRFSTLAGAAVAAAAVPLIAFGAGVAFAEDGSPGGGDSTSSDSSSSDSSTGDPGGSHSSATDSDDGDSSSTGSTGDTSSDGDSSDDDSPGSNESDSDPSGSDPSGSDTADSAGDTGTGRDDAGADDGFATDATDTGDGSPTGPSTPSTTRPHGSDGDHVVVPATPDTTPPATTNSDTHTGTDSTTAPPRTETVVPAPDPGAEVPVIDHIVDPPTVGVPDPGAVPVMTPLTPVAVTTSDEWAPNAFATDLGSDPLPASSLAVVQSSTLGVGATSRGSSLFGLPVVVIPSTPWNLNDPVWEEEWEAFNSSVVAWVPGVGNTLATISVVIDTYQLAAAIRSGDHAEVSDEIGDLAGDIIGIEFGQGIGTQARYLIHLYISDTVATWIVGDPTPVAAV